MSSVRPKAARLGILALVALEVASVVSARNLPVMAIYGWSMLALFLLAILVFLLPISMTAAELGTGWPEEGGIYAWVREAFGGKTGFMAVWCDFAENIPWFPTVLAFMAASFAYAINPSLATNKVYLVSMMLVFFWGTTFVSMRGVTVSAKIAGIGTVLGSILPAVLVVVLGFVWLFSGDGSAIPFSAEALVPDVSLGNLAFLGGIILLFTGMEMVGFHSRETRDPGRNVPRAIFLSVGVIVVFSVLGSLFLAFVVPEKELSLVAGIMEMFERALGEVGASWLVRPIALLVAIGGIAHLSPWILGPSKGVAAVAHNGDAPRSFGKMSPRGVPVGLLIAQGIGGTVFSLLFLFVQNVSTSYWMLSAVTAQVIAIMYGLMFASVIRLRYIQPDQPRPYRIPGGTIGVWLVGGVGVLGCSASLLLGFVPPSQLETGNTVVYVLLLTLATVALCVPPFLWSAWERRHGRERGSRQPLPQ